MVTLFSTMTWRITEWYAQSRAFWNLWIYFTALAVHIISLLSIDLQIWNIILIRALTLVLFFVFFVYHIVFSSYIGICWCVGRIVSQCVIFDWFILCHVTIDLGKTFARCVVSDLFKEWPHEYNHCYRSIHSCRVCS